MYNKKKNVGTTQVIQSPVLNMLILTVLSFTIKPWHSKAYEMTFVKLKA